MAPPATSKPGRLLIALIVLLLGGVVWAFWPGTDSSVRLGLDLQGGTQVILVPQPVVEGTEITEEQLAQTVEIIRARVDGLGVAEAEVTTQGSGNSAAIVVSVPGLGQDRVVELVQRALRLPEAERRTQLLLQCHTHVLQHAHVGEGGRDLERAHHAAAGDVGRLFAGDVVAVEQDLAAGRVKKLRQQVEAGGLAGTVGADQRMDRAATHLEVDVVDGYEALELLDESTRFQNVVRTHAARGALKTVKKRADYA